MYAAIFVALRAQAILLVFGKIYPCLFITNCTRNNVSTYTKYNKFSNSLVLIY